MLRLLFDASVVPAALNSTDALHLPAVSATRGGRDAGHEFIVLMSVLAEVLVRPARRNVRELRHGRELTIATFGPPEPIDEKIAVAAATRRARHSALRLPDALVLATAEVLQADRVLTGDKRWCALDDRVHLIAVA
ncbi:type II toxin-antitoxin system VapC family toxin [Cryptosporangium sp. NPDC048952]|uniref:type II toxin-antitoxin system VapC family toxin n=1 Tax=Cryptosporangium sp. NPDC048952 TaxID=3363961 RepID=UPI003718DEBA